MPVYILVICSCKEVHNYKNPIDMNLTYMYEL